MCERHGQNLRMDNVLDCVVVGAGVVGLAVARALALAGREVVVLEAAEGIGTETSSRNSEVIHAGIYYPKGSLKARLCVQGKQALYAYCAERGVPHRGCGKLIVATEAAQLATLADIRAKAAANGVSDLTPLSRQEAQALARDHGRTVVYKMGEKGSFAFREDTVFETGVYPVEALKPTGAGDAFMAGFATGLARGFDLKASVLRGTAAAAIVVTRVGCAPAMPNPVELDAFMAEKIVSA